MGRAYLAVSSHACAHKCGAVIVNFKPRKFFSVFLAIQSLIRPPEASVWAFNDFQSKSTKFTIYWSPTASTRSGHPQLLLAHGGATSAFGFPVSDETDTFDKGGRFNLFEHGAIYWNAGNGAITTRLNPDSLTGPQQIGQDRTGSDFKHIILPEANPAICEERCASKSKCVAWTYVAPNTIQGPSPGCWLKDAIPVASKKACCTSGMIVA